MIQRLEINVSGLASKISRMTLSTMSKARNLRRRPQGNWSCLEPWSHHCFWINHKGQPSARVGARLDQDQGVCADGLPARFALGHHEHFLAEGV